MERNTSHNQTRAAEWAGIAIIAAAMVLATLVIAGCGGHQEEAANSGGSALVVASTPAAPVQGASQPQAAGDGTAAVSADALPPDVAVAVSDTLVDAGGSVEVTAQGSPDVVAVTLSDGHGSRQPFTYDAASDTWKVFYRMPLKAERVALSTTATTASKRWRRVWLFLSVRHDAPAAVSATPDSSMKR